MKVRKIKKEDKKDVYALALQENKIMQKFFSFQIYKKSINKQEFEKIFKAYLQKDKFFYGVETSNTIITVCQGYIMPQGKIGYLDNIVVLKKYNGGGISTMLKKEFFKWLKNKKIKYCQLHILGSNKKAFQIYSKWGFKIDGTQMTKRLK